MSANLQSKTAKAQALGRKQTSEAKPALKTYMAKDGHVDQETMNAAMVENSGTGLTNNGKPLTKAQRAARAKAEQAVALANHNAIAAKAAKTPVQPKVLKVGSGAAIGVATGAMDGQPHTKRAVQEARAREAAAAKQAGKIVAKDTGGNVVYVDPKNPLLVNGVLHPNATRAGEAKRLIAASKSAKLASGAKTSTPKANTTTTRQTGDRAYTKGKESYAGKQGSWTAYMVQLAIAHTSTEKAKAAHAAKAPADYAKKALDFKWMEAKGYISFTK